MNYAKVVNGDLLYAPRTLSTESVVVYNPMPELLIAQGYRPVQYTQRPEAEAGYVAVPGWTETEDAVIQLWTLEPEGDISDAEALGILLGGESA